MGHEADHCIEVQYPWLQTLWVYLVGIDLFVPFWSILILLQCKKKLDRWLQQTLDDLQQMRKLIITNDDTDTSSWSKETEELLITEQKRVVACLGGFIVDYQDLFMELWNSDCKPMVDLATKMLWCSATVAITLTAFMFWIYLVDRPNDNNDEWHFGVISVIGLSVPVFALFRGWLKSPRQMRSLVRAGSHAEVLRRSSPRMTSRDASPENLDGARTLSRSSGLSMQRTLPTDALRAEGSAANPSSRSESGSGISLQAGQAEIASTRSRAPSGFLDRMRFWRHLGGDSECR